MACSFYKAKAAFTLFFPPALTCNSAVLISLNKSAFCFPLAAGAFLLGTQPLSFDTSSFNQLIRHWLGKLSHHLRLQELDN